MKKIIILFLVASIIFSGCAGSITLNKKNIKPYGVFNQTEKVDGIKYRVCPGSIILSLVFFETLVVPAYLIGWELYEPLPTFEQ